MIGWRRSIGHHGVNLSDDRSALADRGGDALGRSGANCRDAIGGMGSVDPGLPAPRARREGTTNTPASASVAGVAIPQHLGGD
jgi:hypothetical protein